MKESTQQFIAFVIFAVVMFGLAYGFVDVMKKQDLKAAQYLTSVEDSGAAAFKAGAAANANPHLSTHQREAWLNGWIKASRETKNEPK